MNDTAPAPNATSQTSGSEFQPERPKDYAIYKPNARGSGGVIRFGLNVSKSAIFVDAASQSGERQFDWEKKFTMKWGLSDIGSALSLLRGSAPQVKLFHKTEVANSAFELVKQADPERAPYIMSVSRQDATTKELRKVSIPVTLAEAAVLETALEAAVARLIGW